MKVKCPDRAILGRTYTKGRSAIAALMGSYAVGFSRGCEKASTFDARGASARSSSVQTALR